MKTSTRQHMKQGTLFIGLAFFSLVIASCAMAPASPQGAAEARRQLTALQNDPNLADRARVEIREAEAAVQTAEQPLDEAETALGEHRVYIAIRKVAIAKAKATSRYLEAQRARLAEERDEARLQARTREADEARGEASRARSEAEAAREAAQRSKEEATAEAARQAEEYQRQIDALQAEVTDRGMVLTLGDVLFATGSAELQGGANRTLNKLVDFLEQYPDHRVQIEGHTDNVGSSEYNQELSRRRADSVRYYLEQQGIASQRISASGIGMDRPIANNDTELGRQQNRRVEIIIQNPSNPDY